MEKFWVIIPNAGIGERFKAGIPKQYVRIFDKTVLEYSVEIFLRQPWIEKIIIPLAPDDTYFQQLPLANHPKIKTLLGGAIRSDTVIRAMAELKAYANQHDWVLVHDAVRPCLHPADLQTLVKTLKADLCGGILASPMQDTIKHVEANVISHTVDRALLWRALTPQMFRFAILEEALQTCLRLGKNVTDDACAVEEMGLKPRIVTAEHPNPKLTYAYDFSFISMLIEQKQESEVA